MIRLVAVCVAAAVIGAVTGAVAAQGLRPGDGPIVDGVGSTVAGGDGDGAALKDPQSGGLLLVWTPGRLPDELDAGVRDVEGVTAVAAVRAGVVEMTAAADGSGAPVDVAPPGMVIPLDAVVIDRDFVALAAPSAQPGLTGVVGDGVVLSERSAALRRLGPGATVTTAGGMRLRVAGVVADAVIGAAEVAVAPETGDRLGLRDARHLLVAHRGRRDDVEAAIRALSPDATLRIRAPGETPYLRYGDAVLPPIAIKEVFGEFAYRPGAGETVVLDPAWESLNLVTTELPLVGRARCHRALVEPLRGALAELEERNLGHLVDPDAFGGCWNPRRVSGRVELSRHAWGAAVDINVGKNVTGLASVQDRRLVAIMDRWGFTWGGPWLVPDPAHFEYVGPPDAAA